MHVRLIGIGVRTALFRSRWIALFFGAIDEIVAAKWFSD